MQNLSISNFKLFISKIIIPLLIIIIGIAYLLSLLFEKEILLNSNSLGTYKVNWIIKYEDPNEIPIFGSSRAESSFIPYIISENIFNYGLNGTRDNVHLSLLEIELQKKRQTPIILNLDPWGMGYGLGDIYNYILNIDYPIIKELLGENNKIKYSIPILKYYGYYESSINIFLNDKLNLTKSSYKGGCFLINELPSNIFSKLLSERKNTKEFFTLNSKYENKILSLIESTNRKIIIIIAPCHKSFFDSLQNPEDETNFLEKLNNYKNVLVLNYGQDEYSDEEYFDLNHLNYLGAKRFSERVRLDLIENGII